MLAWRSGVTRLHKLITVRVLSGGQTLSSAAIVHLAYGTVLENMFRKEIRNQKYFTSIIN